MFGKLLTKALIQTDRGAHTLPGLMAAMTRGEVATFPALRPHQRPAWHMFLVQLGVLALSSKGVATLPDDEDGWCAALRSLTAEFPDDEPWHLVVEARDRPAFLQPPDPGGLKWSPVATPDALDMLITSRNHDIKRDIAGEAEPQDWLFALVSLQTMEGQGGRGNYGIARMNGGFSSRVLLALAPAGDGEIVVDPSGWWRRDVASLLLSRQGRDFSNTPLTWCVPWPETQTLAFHELDPLFIEVCRRVRLEGGVESITASRANSKARRVLAGHLKGVTGDPWAPIHIRDNKAFTLGERNWDYRLLAELLFRGEWTVPPLAKPGPGENQAPMMLIAEALSRGQSKTDGFQSRMVPVPKAVVKTMIGPLAQDVSKAQIEDIVRIDAILRRGLGLLHCDGDWEKLKKTNRSRSARARMDKAIVPAHAAFDKAADAVFFPTLWAKLEVGTAKGIEAIHHDFVRTLAEAARTEFKRAMPGIPCTRLMRPRAEARAQAAFEVGVRRVFKDLGVKEKADA